MDIDPTRMDVYIDALRRLAIGHSRLELPRDENPELARLGQAIGDLEAVIRQRASEEAELDEIIRQANDGFLLNEILDRIYDDFRNLIPYNRIGLALIEQGEDRVRAQWSRTDLGLTRLPAGYQAVLAGSSLQDILLTGAPRIINDLEAYLAEKPESHSTRLIVSEGIRSSLTCPLIHEGQPLGFIFFSSAVAGTYASNHAKLFTRIADRLAGILAKGNLTTQLAGQKEEIERQNQNLQRLIELRNLIVGIAAHDLRGPLGYIQTTADLLRGPEAGYYESVRLELLTSIHRQASHLLELLNDLLDYTQIEAGQLKLEKTGRDVNKILNESILISESEAVRKGSRISLRTPAEVVVAVDGRRLRQVMDNIISNAIKYSPPGSLVQVRCIRQLDHWLIEVEDQGPGINPLEQERLFQPFGRLSSRPTGGEKSTGLGLVIARNIVRAHGGEMGVRPGGGQGSIFWFTLPD
jgi:signal transduction histidine kinase